MFGWTCGAFPVLAGLPNWPGIYSSIKTLRNVLAKFATLSAEGVVVCHGDLEIVTDILKKAMRDIFNAKWARFPREEESTPPPPPTLLDPKFELLFKLPERVQFLESPELYVRDSFEELLRLDGYDLARVDGDGNCFYRAVVLSYLPGIAKMFEDELSLQLRIKINEKDAALEAASLAEAAAAEQQPPAPTAVASAMDVDSAASKLSSTLESVQVALENQSHVLGPACASGFAPLVAAVAAAFPQVAKPAIQYVDGQNELLTIGSDVELHEAVRLAELTPSRVLKLSLAVSSPARGLLAEPVRATPSAIAPSSKAAMDVDLGAPSAVASRGPLTASSDYEGFIVKDVNDARTMMKAGVWADHVQVQKCSAYLAVPIWLLTLDDAQVAMDDQLLISPGPDFRIGADLPGEPIFLHFTPTPGHYEVLHRRHGRPPASAVDVVDKFRPQASTAFFEAVKRWTETHTRKRSGSTGAALPAVSAPADGSSLQPLTICRLFFAMESECRAIADLSVYIETDTGYSWSEREEIRTNVVPRIRSLYGLLRQFKICVDQLGRGYFSDYFEQPSISSLERLLEALCLQFVDDDVVFVDQELMSTGRGPISTVLVALKNAQPYDMAKSIASPFHQSFMYGSPSPRASPLATSPSAWSRTGAASIYSTSPYSSYSNASPYSYGLSPTTTSVRRPSLTDLEPSPPRKIPVMSPSPAATDLPNHLRGTSPISIASPPRRGFSYSTSPPMPPLIDSEPPEAGVSPTGSRSPSKPIAITHPSSTTNRSNFPSWSTIDPPR
eukprot:TRINITY_DN3810_c0_g1_i1.p1 TRINITY_DN3810_c0_g1~~TRINITY_DN3810_c0_g1_i1.p1  ORF type:complete len:784 (+),score=281.36 TRINITY_DN3810_c0_g1_i1:807-3158(+)